MNFDELKKQWDNQVTNEVEVTIDLEKHKEANSIIDKIRKVMKKDFFFQLTIFPILLVYPFIFGVSTPTMWFVMLCYVIILAFPLFTLFKFYKQSYQMEYNSLKSLNWFYYNYQFSITLFRIYNYVAFSLVIMFIGIVMIEKAGIQFENVPWTKLAFVAFLLVLFAVFCVWMTKWWINKLYAQPLKEIKQVLDDLEG